MSEEFDDFKPAVTDGVNPAIKKAIAKEMSELETFKVDNDAMIYSYDEPKIALTEMMVEYIQIYLAQQISQLYKCIWPRHLFSF